MEGPGARASRLAHPIPLLAPLLRGCWTLLTNYGGGAGMLRGRLWLHLSTLRVGCGPVWVVRAG